MKIRTSVLLLLSATLLAFSCTKDNSNYGYLFPNALVTAKTTDDGVFYLQLDDKTKLQPTNMDKSPFDTEMRALVNVTISKESADVKDGGVFTSNDRKAKVNAISKVLTKATVPTEGDTQKDDEKYGTAPLELINNWVTVVEDEYLTVCFYAVWGYEQNTHYINLVTGTNPEDPYELVLRHDANGDTIAGGGREVTSIAAFSLKDLPDTNGETVKLKIKFNSFTGEKTVKFDYCTGASTGKSTQLPLSSVNTSLAIE